MEAAAPTWVHLWWKSQQHPKRLGVGKRAATLWEGLLPKAVAVPSCARLLLGVTHI